MLAPPRQVLLIDGSTSAYYLTGCILGATNSLGQRIHNGRMTDNTEEYGRPAGRATTSSLKYK